jgi:acetyl-CoA synthetase (ADP-forming)
MAKNLFKEVVLRIIENALMEGRKTLSEYESKEILRSYGIPVTLEKMVHDTDSLKSTFQEIPFPLVLKGCAPNLSHKTERNLVHLDIRSEEKAVAAFEEIMKEVKDEGGRVLVQEMIEGPRELVVGLVRDEQFGPCVMFGLGGIFTEILKDIVFRVAPLKKRDAFDMMEEIKSSKILEEVRGMPAADKEQLADILIKIGNIGMEQRHIKEIDINPIILAGSRPVAVDALVVLES